MKRFPTTLLLVPILALSLSGLARAEEEGVIDKTEAAVKRGAEATARGVKKGVEATTHAVKRGAEATAHGIETGVSAAGRGIKRGAEATGNALHKAGEKLSPSDKSPSDNREAEGS